MLCIYPLGRTIYLLSVGFCVARSGWNGDARTRYAGSVKDGELVLLYDNSTFKRSGMIESNAFENKLSGLKINYGGHSLAEHYKTIGQCNYYLEFTNDYRAYRIIEKVYWNDRKRDTTKSTLCHYIFHDGFLYIAPENESYSPQFIYDPDESNCFYYIKEGGGIALP